MHPRQYLTCGNTPNWRSSVGTSFRGGSRVGAGARCGAETAVISCLEPIMAIDDAVRALVGSGAGPRGTSLCQTAGAER